MNAARVKHLDQVRQLYGPNLGTLTDNMSSMGESLQAACYALADDCTLERVDLMLARLKGAEHTLVHIRKALAGPRESTVQSGGTG